MKKFILRFPKSEKEKVIGGLLLDVANRNIETADQFCKDVDGVYTEQGVDLIRHAMKLKNSAAKHFGFRSFEEMEEYRRIHGKI